MRTQEIILVLAAFSPLTLFVVWYTGQERYTYYKKTTNFKADRLKNISDPFVGLCSEYKVKVKIRSEMIQVLSGS